MEQVEEIITKVCEVFGVTKEEALGKSRRQPLPLVRLTIAALLDKKTNLTRQEIREVLGKDRTTIIYYLQQYESEYAYNISFRTKLNKIEEDLRRVSLKRKISIIFNTLLFGKCGD